MKLCISRCRQGFVLYTSLHKKVQSIYLRIKYRRNNMDFYAKENSDYLSSCFDNTNCMFLQKQNLNNMYFHL